MPPVLGAMASPAARPPGVNPTEVVSLFTSQVAAALQFEMEEVFAMTSEGLRGRLLMLQHAKAQGFAPHNADKLIMFLNLELQERAAGRFIDLQNEQSECAPHVRPQAPEQPAPPVRAAALEAGKREAGAIKQAPAFSSGAATSGAGAAHARSNAAGSARVASAPSSQPPKESSVSGAAARSDSGSQGLRDRPWNRKKKAALSEGFTIGENGRMEVCFITSSASNKRKPAKKKPDVSDDPVPKPVRRQGLSYLSPFFSRHGVQQRNTRNGKTASITTSTRTRDRLVHAPAHAAMCARHSARVIWPLRGWTHVQVARSRVQAALGRQAAAAGKWTRRRSARRLCGALRRTRPSCSSNRSTSKVTPAAEPAAMRAVQGARSRGRALD